MSKKPDPEKALYLKPGQRRLPGSKKHNTQAADDEWVEHKGSSALDEWGLALRILRKLGKSS
jgi:hypothetical protein